MDTKQKKEGNMKKNTVTHVTIFVVVASLIVIAVLLATSNFDFVDIAMKLHGG